jgi:AcrR family transcriptional regulator
MRRVSIPYEANGRVRQKQRTRTALVAAAADLVAAGVTPTVEEAAAAAGVSRPTAYRYFPNQWALLAAAHPETVAATLLPEDPPTDPAERLASVVAAYIEIVMETEAQQRTMLRLSLDADPDARAALPLRQGRAIGWFDEALAPLADQLSDQARHALVLAIRSATGIEALAWLTDVAGVARADAAALMRWSAQALLQAALVTPPPVQEADSDPVGS